MPRGNDSEAAGQELRARLGESPNAEEMIALSAERWTPELRAANNRPVDQEATDDLDDSKAQGFVGDDREVLGYAVRGPFLVVVSADETGFTTKEAFALDEKAAKKLAPPEPEADDSGDDDSGDAAKTSGGRTAAARK